MPTAMIILAIIGLFLAVLGLHRMQINIIKTAIKEALHEYDQEKASGPQEH